jgi:hypothetical protein
MDDVLTQAIRLPQHDICSVMLAALLAALPATASFAQAASGVAARPGGVADVRRIVEPSGVEVIATASEERLCQILRGDKVVIVGGGAGTAFDVHTPPVEARVLTGSCAGAIARASAKALSLPSRPKGPRRGPS